MFEFTDEQRQLIAKAIQERIYPESVGKYGYSEGRPAVRWDDDHAQWKTTMESIHNMDAWFYVRVGELADGESPSESVGVDTLNVRFVVPTKIVQDNWKEPKWHSDKVRIYLRSYLHEQGYEFYPELNLAVRRTK